MWRKNIQRIAKAWFKPETRREKKTPNNHIRNVLTGIVGSSTLATAARTSG
jgi:hypothetical protein